MARALFPLSTRRNASRNGCFGGRESETIEPTDREIWGVSVQKSDATVFFTEILPKLSGGTMVGLHDIFLPHD
jgi:hypothetical protein